MAIVINNFTLTIASAAAYTVDQTGSDNALIYIGTAIEATTGRDGVVTGATHSTASFASDSDHATTFAFGTQTFTNAGGWILDANIIAGSQTFTQSTTGTFDDTTFSILSISGADQTTTEKEITAAVTYNSTTPGNVTYNIDAGGLAVLIVLTNINTVNDANIVGQGWTRQSAGKALGIITDYEVFTRIAASAETGTTVTPAMTGNGTGRGFAKVWVYNAAPADTDVLATSQSLTISSQNSIVTSLIDKNINVTSQALVITSNQAIVEALNNKNITADSQNLTLTSFNAAVGVSANLTVNATSQNLSIAGNGATVQANVNLNINTTSANLAITGNDASISRLTNTGIIASSPNLTLTAQNTIVTSLVSLNVNPATRSLIMTVFNVNISSVASYNITANLRQLSLISYQSEITTGVLADYLKFGVSSQIINAIGQSAIINNNLGIGSIMYDNLGVTGE